MKPPSSRRSQRGIALILVTAAMVVLVGIAGLALDLGIAEITMTRLQNALDAAALRGAKTLSSTGDTDQAKADAAEEFNSANLGVTIAATDVELSDTLLNFGASTADPKFVRVTLPELPVTMRLARVLPGVGDEIDVGSSAVAGPITLDNPCGVVPIMLCAVDGDGDGEVDDDDDCSDGSCFGYTVTGTELCIRAVDDGGTNTCDPSQYTSGNYGMLDVGTGGAAVRKALAGGRYCPGDTVATQPGAAVGPVSQGIGMRFGPPWATGPLSPSEYPPDVVTANPQTHADYTAALDSGTWQHPPPEGVPQRRIVIVPVVDCGTLGPGSTSNSIPVLGTACFFLTRPVDNDGNIYGQLISSCTATGGTAGSNPPASGPTKIILYKDEDSQQS